MKLFFNIPYMNMQGSNQHKRHIRRIAGLKVKTWLTIIIIVLVLFILTVPMYLSEQYNRKINMFDRGLKVYAETRREYKAPPLADETTQEAMIGVIKKVWRKDWKIGVALARCESGLRPDAVNRYNRNGSVDVGLLQVNSVHGISEKDLLNPYANAGYAYAIYNEQGTGPWFSSRKCWEGNV
jgi:hypothetical protein